MRLKAKPTRPRPWGEPTPEEDEAHGAYAEYGRWQRWMAAAIDVDLDRLAEAGILDTLNFTQKAYLFNLMGRLADGEAPPCA